MSDIKCPYCETWQEINHDDGYGYEEDKEFEQHCVNCSIEFIFYTSISFSYEAQCQKHDHIMIPAGDKWPNLMECVHCEYFDHKPAETKDDR